MQISTKIMNFEHRVPTPGELFNNFITYSAIQPIEQDIKNRYSKLFSVVLHQLSILTIHPILAHSISSLLTKHYTHMTFWLAEFNLDETISAHVFNRVVELYGTFGTQQA